MSMLNNHREYVTMIIWSIVRVISGNTGIPRSLFTLVGWCKKGTPWCSHIFSQSLFVLQLLVQMILNITSYTYYTYIYTYIYIICIIIYNRFNRCCFTVAQPIVLKINLAIDDKSSSSGILIFLSSSQVRSYASLDQLSFSQKWWAAGGK